MYNNVNIQNLSEMPQDTVKLLHSELYLQLEVVETICDLLDLISITFLQAHIILKAGHQTYSVYKINRHCGPVLSET